MTSVRKYLAGLSNYVGTGWNRFWYTPSDVFDLCAQRVVCGLLAIVWQLSFTPQLIAWFGPQGWFDGGLYRAWVVDPSMPTFSGRLSYLFVSSPGVLWVLHFLGTAVLVAFALGWWTRISSVLAFGVVLAYIHRAPFLSSAAEPVLSMMIGYLCLAPSGAYLSLDARRMPQAVRGPTPWATLARHLMQLHLATIYLLMFCTKLAGVTWWNGDALWWSVAQPSSQLLDLSFLKSQPILLNLWTYFVLLSEASMATLVWNRWLRPVILVVSAFSWLSIAVATGNAALPATMWVANLAFVSSDQWRTWLAPRPPELVELERVR